MSLESFLGDNLGTKLHKKYENRQTKQRKREDIIFINTLILCGLRIYIFSSYVFLFTILLPDAKMFENIPKYHIVRNFPCNIA